MQRTFLPEKKITLLFFLLYIFLINGCSKNTTPTEGDEENTTLHSNQFQTEEAILEYNFSPALNRFAATVDEHYDKLLTEASILNKTLLAFAKEPSDEGLNSTLSSLDNTHAIYSSLAILFECCPSIKLSTAIQTLETSETPAITIPIKLDHQPLLPGYLDSVNGYPYSGLIHSDIPISTESMLKEFQLGDPAYVTLGFHPLLTMLKGGSDNRKLSDFAPLQSTQDTETAPAELRRTLYIILLAAEINKDLAALQKAWLLDAKLRLSKMDDTQAKTFFEQLDTFIVKHLDSNDQAGSGHLSKADLIRKKDFLDQLRSLEDAPADTP